MQIPEPLLLYDDDCGLCHAAMRFVKRHDRHRVFHLAPLDSPLGQAVRARWDIPATVDSIIVMDGGEAAVRSGAVFKVLRRLGGAWHLLRIGQLVPRALTDAVYDAVAGRRSRIAERMGWRCER